MPLAAKNETFTYSAPAIKSRTSSRAKYNSSPFSFLSEIAPDRFPIPFAATLPAV